MSSPVGSKRSFYSLEHDISVDKPSPKKRRVDNLTDKKLINQNAKISPNYQVGSSASQWNATGPLSETGLPGQGEEAMHMPWHALVEHVESLACETFEDLCTENPTWNAGLATSTLVESQIAETKLSLARFSASLSSCSSEENSSFAESSSSSEFNPALRAALDEALCKKTKNVEPLLNLINDGNVCFTRDEVDEIFDYALVEKKRPVLLKSINLGLAKHQRSDLLKHALRKNDLQLAKAAVDGKPGQSRLDFNEWSFNASGIQVALQKELWNNQEMITYLLSLTSLDKSDFEEIGWRLFLSNMWGLDEGQFALKGENINYAGAFPWMCDSKVSEGILAFQGEFPKLLEDDLIQELRDLIEGAAQGVSVEERLQRYREHKPIKIHGGCKNHQLEVFLWDYILLVANRGLFSEVPIKVYTIDPAFVTERRLKKIKRSNQKFDEDSARKFFTEVLPNKLNGTNFDNTHGPLTDAFTKNWIGPLEMATETCVADSLCTFLAGAAAIHAWYKRGRRYNAIPPMLKKTNLLVTYLLYNAAEQYLAYSAEDPSKMDKNLFAKIIAKAKSKAAEAPVLVCGTRLGKDFWKKKAEALEERYKVLFPMRVTLRLKRPVDVNTLTDAQTSSQKS